MSYKAITESTNAIGTPNPKELSLEVLGIHGLNAFCAFNSSARAVMFSSHIAQSLCLINPTTKRIMTGLEKQLSDYTFDIRIPVDARIIKVIDRYPTGIDANSLKYNPESIVIYENDVDKSIDCINLVSYRKLHQYFGFDYKYRDTLSSLKSNSYVAKDTIIATPRSVTENGDYMYGINAKAVFMNIPSVAEDGIAVREGFLENLKFKVYETRTIEFGLNSYPLNIYGDITNYKPFPDIGDYVKEDGMLIALRDYEPDLSPIDMSMYDTKEVDYVFDKCLYTRAGKGKVIDIKVYKNPAAISKTPDIIAVHLDKYVNAYTRFNKELVDLESKLRMESKKKYGSDQLKLGRNLHKLLTTAHVVLDPYRDKFNRPIALQYKKKTIDQYRVEIVVEHEVIPTIGFKATCTSAGKGVICSIIPDKDMPRDELGRVADVVLDPVATVNRMNLGRLYEHYMNDLLEQTEMKLKAMVNFTKDTSVDDLLALDSSVTNNALEYLFNLLKLLCPKQHDYLRDLSADDKVEYLHSVLSEHITVHMPPDTEVNVPGTIMMLEKSVYKPYVGKISYTGASGNPCVTVNDIRLSDIYLMLLDKISDDWSSVSVSKLQHFGIISANRLVKHDYPYRCSPVRVQGETENRILAGYTSQENVAELMDRNNNPLTMRSIVYKILDTDKPGNIDSVVDRVRIPYGSNKPLQLVNHVFGVSGFKVKYVNYPVLKDRA